MKKLVLLLLILCLLLPVVPAQMKHVNLELTPVFVGKEAACTLSGLDPAVTYKVKFDWYSGGSTAEWRFISGDIKEVSGVSSVTDTVLFYRRYDPPNNIGYVKVKIDGGGVHPQAEIGPFYVEEYVDLEPKPVIEVLTPEVAAGSAFRVKLSAVNVSGPYSFRYLWMIHEGESSYGFGAGSTLPGPGGEISHLVEFGDKGELACWLVDGNGKDIGPIQEATFQINGATPPEAPLKISANITAREANSGETVTVTASATGGTPGEAGYTYTFQLREWREEQFYTQVQTGEAVHSFVMPESKKVIAMVEVQDSLGRIRGEYFNIDIHVSETASMPGDVNLDKEVNLADLMLLIEHLQNSALLYSQLNGDTTGDKQADAGALSLIINKIIE